LIAPLAIAACGSSGPGMPAGPKGNVVLLDANNYTAHSTLTIPTVDAQSGADLTVCWDGIAKDILCHDVSATADIDNVSFLQIPNMTHDQAQLKLASGTLDENLVKVYRDFHVDHSVTPPQTCTTLSTLALGTKLDPTKDFVQMTGTTYMLLFEHGTTPGVGAKTMTFLNPLTTSNVTSVTAPDGCASNILSFSATLGTALSIPTGGPWLLDWSQITHDSMGNAPLFNKIDSVLVGFYQGMTVADLQTHFLDIQIIATSLYQVTVPPGARDVDLAGAVDQSDATKTFPGFAQSDGVWLAAVMCSKCQLPAPVALAVLQPQ
jgi:hypothetical protein